MATHDKFELANQRAKNLATSVPKTVAAHYDRASRRIVIELGSRVHVSFSPRDAQGLEHAKPSQLAKSRSVRPVSEFTFPNLMPISTCQVSWKVFSAPSGGWHPGSAKLEASPEAPQRKPPPKRMAAWRDDRGRQPAINFRKMHWKTTRPPVQSL